MDILASIIERELHMIREEVRVIREAVSSKITQGNLYNRDFAMNERT